MKLRISRFPAVSQSRISLNSRQSPSNFWNTISFCQKEITMASCCLEKYEFDFKLIFEKFAKFHIFDRRSFDQTTFKTFFSILLLNNSLTPLFQYNIFRIHRFQLEIDFFKPNFFLIQFFSFKNVKIP